MVFYGPVGQVSNLCKRKFFIRSCRVSVVLSPDFSCLLILVISKLRRICALCGVIPKRVLPQEFHRFVSVLDYHPVFYLANRPFKIHLLLVLRGEAIDTVVTARTSQAADILASVLVTC